MINTILHYLSFLKHAFYLWGTYLVYKEAFQSSQNHLEDLSLGLLLFGLGMSLEGLQDERKIGKIRTMLFKRKIATRIYLLGSTCIFIIDILFALNTILNLHNPQLGGGVLAFGIGGISLIKMEYNRYSLFREYLKKQATSES